MTNVSSSANVKLDAIKVVVDFNADDIATNLTNIVVNKTKIDAIKTVVDKLKSRTTYFLNGLVNGTTYGTLLNYTGSGVLQFLRLNRSGSGVKLKLTIDGVVHENTNIVQGNPNPWSLFTLKDFVTGNMVTIDSVGAPHINIEFKTSLKIEYANTAGSDTNISVQYLKDN